MGWSKENRLISAQIGKNRRVLIRRQAEIQRGSGCPPLPPNPKAWLCSSRAFLLVSMAALSGFPYLTEELVRLGHDVTLFASADFITSAELAPCCTRALRLDPTVRDSIPHFTLMIDKVYASDFFGHLFASRGYLRAAYQDDNEESEKDPRA